MAKGKKAPVEAPVTEQMKPTYEELEAAYMDLRARSDKSDVITRLQFDFLALEHSKELPKNYVNAVIRDVMTLLPMNDIDIDAEIATLSKKAKA